MAGIIQEFQIYIHASCHFTERVNDDAVGNGGFGVVITSNGKQLDEIAGGLSFTTNARMDIIGIAEALKRIQEPSNIIIYLSNGYVIDTLTKGWLEIWKRENFKKKKHVDLWKELDKILQSCGHKILFQHSKKVAYTKGYQLAEQLAKTMSGKKNLPIDLKSKGNGGLFTVHNSNEVLELENTAPNLDSICVDASTINNPGLTEYRGVDTKTGQILFSHKYEEATNNIGEFLAIVHALALFKSQGKELNIIYSDSANAISWIKEKKCKTKYEKSEKNIKLFKDIDRAIAWLENNSYETKILKWNTGAWGQTPADYGRK